MRAGAAAPSAPVKLSRRGILYGEEPSSLARRTPAQWKN
jgi:hypothetical protein